MSQLLTKTLEQTILDRRSVRRYRPNVSIPEQDLKKILKLAGDAPSAWNLQHWRFLVIDDPESKKKVLPAANHQQQVMEASAVLVILGDLEAYKMYETVFGPMVRAGFMKQEAYEAMEENIRNAYANDRQFARDEAFRNASLAAMQLMLAAKSEGYDTCPMSGFDPQALTEVLNIPERYVPVMMITIGSAMRQAHRTRRLPVEQFIIKNRFSPVPSE